MLFKCLSYFIVPENPLYNCVEWICLVYWFYNIMLVWIVLLSISEILYSKKRNILKLINRFKKIFGNHIRTSYLKHLLDTEIPHLVVS